MYHHSKEGPQTHPKWLPNTEAWIELAALTLTEMMDNPFIQCENDPMDSQPSWAMQTLYQTACETKTLHAIIQQFAELAPVEKFIPTMNCFIII